MKKNLIILSIVLIVLLALFFLIPEQKKSKSNVASNSTDPTVQSSNSGNLFPANEDNSIFSQKAEAVFQEDNFMPYEELIENLRKGKVNLVWELWEVRRKCPGDYSFEQCNALIRAMLEKKYPPPHNKTMVQLFESYLKYERDMRDMELDSQKKGLKFKEKYELAKKKRRDILGEENARLVFGLEEAKVEFADSQKDFYKTTANLPAEKRIEEYEKLREKIYGEYYQTVKERELPYDKYQVELVLRDEELSKLDSAQKEAKVREVEVRIFGKDIADKMAAAREDLHKDESKVKEYEDKEKEFLSQNSGLSEKDRNEKLKQLRISVLGADRAEQYSIKKDLDNALKQVK